MYEFFLLILHLSIKKIDINGVYACKNAIFREKYVSMREINMYETHWYDRVVTSFMFFTTLPLGRLGRLTAENSRTVVEYWPLVGWFTAAVMAAVLYFGSGALPYSVAVLLAIVVRLLLGAGQNEEGLATFVDAFAVGGGSRQHVLDAMSTSRSGVRGVLALIMYVALLFALLFNMTPFVAAITILAAEPFSKMLAAQVASMMPPVSMGNDGVVFRRMPIEASMGLAVQGLLPMGAYCYYMRAVIDWQMLVFLPCLAMYFLYLLIWKILRGYNLQCLSSLALLVELAVYFVVCYYQTLDVV